MTIFNFLKKVFAKSKIENTEKEKLNFSEIGVWISKKKKENEIRERNVFDIIQKKIDIFVDDFKKKIEIARATDISSKKSEERLKLISERGRKEYLESAENFIENLDKLEKNNLEQFSKKIDKIFLDFNKSSGKNYERATILIGKEMAEVKETLKVFSKDLIKLFEENKEIINLSKVFYFIELKLNEVEEINEKIEKIEKSINFLDKILPEKENEGKKISKKIEEIKKSDDYIKNLSKKEKIKILKEDLEKEIFELKQIIDFKGLANFYHIFEDKMELVKEYRDNFQTEFKKNEGENVLKSLLENSNLNNEQINKKIEKIKNIEKDILTNEREIKPDEIQKLFSQLSKIILDTEDLQNEKAKQRKRMENLEIVKNSFVEVVKKKVENIGGEF